MALTINPNGVAILLGNGSGGFASPVTHATWTLPNGLTAADVNGDGKLDIIATGSEIDVFLGNGDGTFPTQLITRSPDFRSRLAQASLTATASWTSL